MPSSKPKVGLLEPTHGTAIIGGHDIHTGMDSIYSLMGVCPQHDLLWDSLTGREHLLFYGRLKGLEGEGCWGWGCGAYVFCACVHTCMCVWLGDPNASSWALLHP